MAGRRSGCRGGCRSLTNEVGKRQLVGGRTGLSQALTRIRADWDDRRGGGRGATGGSEEGRVLEDVHCEDKACG